MKKPNSDLFALFILRVFQLWCIANFVVMVTRVAAYGSQVIPTTSWDLFIYALMTVAIIAAIVEWILDIVAEFFEYANG